MKQKIDLYADNIDYPWCNIELDKHGLLIGMYECGSLERKLFLIDKKKAIDLANTILNLVNLMEESPITRY